MKSIHVVSFIFLLIFAAAPCSAQKASTLHIGVTLSTLHVGITPSTLYIGVTPSSLHIGITPSTLHVGVTPSTLHIGIEPSTLDISGGIYPTFVFVSPVLQSYDLLKTGPESGSGSHSENRTYRDAPKRCQNLYGNMEVIDGND